MWAIDYVLLVKACYVEEGCCRMFILCELFLQNVFHRVEYRCRIILIGTCILRNRVSITHVFRENAYHFEKKFVEHRSY